MTDEELARRLVETASLLNHFLHVAQYRKLKVGVELETSPLLRISNISVSRA